jgi:hypothetical protein
VVHEEQGDHNEWNDVYNVDDGGVIDSWRGSWVMNIEDDVVHKVRFIVLNLIITQKL